MEIKNVAIVGMGALGILYGTHIQNACGKDSVCFVMDEKRKEKYEGTVFSCNGEEKRFPIISAKEAKPADLLIVAVKYTGLQDAMDVMESCIDEHTIIISVLNGISSEEIIGARYGMEKIVYTVAQGMDAMKFGNSLNYTKMGQLHIGMTKSCDEKRLEALAYFFDQIKMPYILEEDILYRMWCKFMLNVGVNQTCMVYGTTYSGVLVKGEANRSFIAAMREVIAIANAENVALTENDLYSYVKLIETLSPSGTPSMGQDRINKRASEVDMFAGAVIEIARKHNIFVPENEFLYERAKEIEKEYVRP